MSRLFCLLVGTTRLGPEVPPSENRDEGGWSSVLFLRDFPDERLARPHHPADKFLPRSNAPTLSSVPPWFPIRGAVSPLSDNLQPFAPLCDLRAFALYRGCILHFVAV